MGMTKVDLGSVYLPDEFIAMINEHRDLMIEGNKDTQYYEMLLKSSFSDFFGDFIWKYYYRMKDK